MIRRLAGVARRCSRRGLDLWVAWIGSAAACLAYVLPKGQDANWDQLNYHIYDVYALLHGRAAVDILPAQLQTWTNPFGEVLQYLLVTYSTPLTATAVLAVLASATVSLVYVVAKRAMRDRRALPPCSGSVMAGLAAVGAFSAPLFLSEVGTTFNDYVGSLLVLLAILVVVSRQPCSARARLASGMLLGLALDTKLSNVSYVIGWFAALLVVERRDGFRAIALTALGAAASYLPIGGAWNLHLYRLFGNPVFPLYNHVFRSDAYPPLPMVFDLYRPKSIADALGYFPKWLLGAHSTNELDFRDARFPLVLALGLLVLARALSAVAGVAGRAGAGIFDRGTARFIVALFICSFAVWQAMFSIQRFAIPLEQLAPLVIVILLSWLFANPRAVPIAAAASIALVVMVSRVPDWGRVRFGDDWYDARVPAELQTGQTLFVMLSWDPIAYVIPSLPASDAFIRIDSNMPLDPEMGLGRMVQSRLASHRGDIRTLSPLDFPEARSAERLRAFGLAAGAPDCLEIVTKAGRLKSCPLARLGP